MKTRVIWLLAAMGLLAVSCMVKEPEQDAMMTDAPRITAMVAAESPATKVSVTESDGEARSTVWDKGDEIAVFIHNAKVLEYALEGDGGASSGVFSYVSGFGGAIQFPEVYGVYPYAKDVAFTGSTLQVNFPAAQAYTENSFDPKANLMVAASRTNDLYFRNVGGYLVLKLWGEDVSVKKIVIKGVAGEPLAGPAAVWASESEAPEIEIAEETAQKAITLTCETPVALGATEDTGTEFWIVVPPTRFEEGLTVTVYGEDGSVFTRTAKGDDTEDGSLSIARKEVYRLSTEVKMGTEDANGHEYVEMAPGFKVATCNVGAETPEERGDVFKWGETEPASSLNFDWDTYKWFDATATDWSVYNVDYYGRLTKYMTWMKHTEDDWATYDLVDAGDHLMRLEPEDDAATVNWGGDWHMPTAAQMEYLTNEDYFTWTKVTREDAEGNEVTGYEVVSRVPGFEGNTVFLPSLVYEEGDVCLLYWTADVSDTYYCNSAYALDDSYGYLDFNDYYYRSNPFPVRPVLCQSTAEEITFPQSSYQLLEGMYLFLDVTFMPEYADVQEVTWVSSDESVATVDNNGSVQALGLGSAVITATTETGKTASCTVTVSQTPDPAWPIGKQFYSSVGYGYWLDLDNTMPGYCVWSYAKSNERIFNNTEIYIYEPCFLTARGGLGFLLHSGTDVLYYLLEPKDESTFKFGEIYGALSEGSYYYDSYNIYELVSPAEELTFEDVVLELGSVQYPMWTIPDVIDSYTLFTTGTNCMNGASEVTLPIQTGLGYGDEGDYEGLDLTGKIAVVSRGDISFYVKLNYAAAAGAIAIIVVNNQEGKIRANITGATYNIPFFIVPKTAYDALMEADEARFVLTDTPSVEYL